ncbi:MAG: hypothetical protein SOY68_13510 [Fusobacterium varium]|nr:hypothetical protein [Fusobacterium varium]
MPGFILLKGNLKNDFSNYRNERLIIENLEYQDIKIQRRTIKKFLNDKIFYQDKNYLIVVEGVIFNKFELIEKYKENNFKETIIKMYKNNEEFFSEFRGSFSGIFIDKLNNIIKIYTNHIGEKRVYFYNEKNKLIVASNMIDLVNILKINNLSYSLNKLGVYTFLTYGTMLEDYTILNEVKLLKAGQYLKIKCFKVEILRYHKFVLKRINENSVEEIINKIDVLFNKAVKNQVDKNKEYNYLNLAPLSAGNDSRMTNFVLKKYCKNILNITYSQNGYYDEIIPKKIASDLKNHWLFKSLDNGLSYKYFEEAIYISYGEVYSSAICQLLDVFKKLNLDESGVIHTGMFGECLAGDECEAISIPYKSIKYKKKFEELYAIYNQKEKFDNLEIENYYNGSFICAHYGSPKFFNEYSESFSPFYDTDFIEYTLNIPKKWRKNYFIYDKWILTKYPEAAKYNSNGRKIGCKYLKVGNREIPAYKSISIILDYILRKLKFKKNNLETKKSMHPVDYWSRSNYDLKIFLDGLFDKNIENINNYTEIYNDCKKMYFNGNVLEKDFVLTFLLSYKEFFINK